MNLGCLPNAEAPTELPALLPRLLPVLLPRLLPVLLIRLPVLLVPLTRLVRLLVRLSIAEPVADFESSALIADAASTLDDGPSSFDLPICGKPKKVKKSIQSSCTFGKTCNQRTER